MSDELKGWEKVAMKQIAMKLKAEFLLLEIYEDYFDVSDKTKAKVEALLKERKLI